MVPSTLQILSYLALTPFVRLGVGFVRFLQGPYLYMIKRRRLLGWIGGHAIYGIDEMALIPIPNRSSLAKQSSEETRYVGLLLGNVWLATLDSALPSKLSHLTPLCDRVCVWLDSYMNLFLSLDLTRDWYYSHTYNLSQPLQYNMMRQPLVMEEKYVWNRHLQRPLEEAVGVDSARLWTVALMHGFWEQLSMCDVWVGDVLMSDCDGM